MISQSISNSVPIAAGDAPDLSFLANPHPVGTPNFWEHAPGQVIAWNEYGDPGGTAVFYYHGWPSSRLQARIAHHLARERGLRLIAMDRPGIGKSTFIPQRTLRDWPPLMAAFADHLGIETFGQIGVSGGGPYVLACASSIPERLVRSVVLAGMVPLPLTSAGTSGLHPIYRALIPLRKSPPPFFTGLFRIAASISAGQPGRFPLSALVRSLAEKDRALLLGSAEVWEVATTSFSESVSTKDCGRGIMMDSDIYFQDPGFDPSVVTHPIRYWHGGDDKNIPPTLAEDLASTMAHASLTVDLDLGHFSLAVLRAPDALDYLAGYA